MPIRAVTTYDYATYKRFHHFHVNKGRPFEDIIMGVLCAAGLLYAIWSLMRYGYSTYLLGPMAILAAIAGLRLYVYLGAPALQYKSNHRLANLRNEYEFEESVFTTRASGTHASGNSTISYDALYRVYETRDCLYLYLSRMEAFIVPKDGLTQGTAQELAALLAAKLPSKKYIRRG